VCRPTMRRRSLWVEETYPHLGVDPARVFRSLEGGCGTDPPGGPGPDARRGSARRWRGKEATRRVTEWYSRWKRSKHLDINRQTRFSASGDLVEVVATQVDVTERKRAEEALRESEYKSSNHRNDTKPLWSTGPRRRTDPTQSAHCCDIAACDLRIFSWWLGGIPAPGRFSRN